jgi:hypothetical protein
MDMLYQEVWYSIVMALKQDAHPQYIHIKSREASKLQIIHLETTHIPPEYVLVSQPCGQLNEQNVG